MRQHVTAYVSHLFLSRFRTQYPNDSNIIVFVVDPFDLRIRNTCIDKAVCGSAKQTARLTFTTVTKAFMVLIIKSSQDQTGKPQWMWL